MDNPSRLFDVAEFQWARYPQRVMLAEKKDGAWNGWSTQEVIARSKALAAGILRLGVHGRDLTPEHQDKVAVVSANRPEWILLDLACQQLGAVLVPIYPTIHDLELAFILKNAAVRLLFVGDEGLYHKVQGLHDPEVAAIPLFTFDAIDGAGHLDELCTEPTLEEKMRVQQLSSTIRPEHLATIIYTSGTTGDPKGVMLSHHNILSNVLSCFPYLPVSPSGKALSFLPLNHVYERMITYLYIYGGVSVYYAESMETIGDNLREVQPDIFTTVPRLLEKVYERILATGSALKGVKRALFYWSIEVGSRYELHRRQGAFYRLQLALARKLVFVKWRKALGGRIQAVVTGSAACQVRLLRLFTAAEITVLEGYGLTETSPVISVNRMEPEQRMFGTVGPVIQGVEVRIAEDGEILCKGPNVMMGYFRQPQLTAEAVTDGWFHTGDLGELGEEKFLKIVDRKKELFKTSGGKYVAPQPIENKMQESPFIESIMVVGVNRKFPAALIVPRTSYLQEWCRRHGMEAGALAEMVARPEVMERIKKEVNRYNEFFSHVEQVKKIALIADHWSVESGELSPTLKLKRKVITARYASLIDQLYQDTR